MSTQGSANKVYAARILVIDDEPLLRQMLQTRLTQDRYDVIVAANGDEGVRLQQQQHFDLVLVDAIMPGRSGLDVIAMIQASKNPPCIVLMSAARREDLAMDALRLGVFDFISKDDAHTFVAKRLPELVARALDEGRAGLDVQAQLHRQEMLIERLKRRAREAAALFQLEQALVGNRDQMHVAARSIADIVPQLLAHVRGGEVRVRLLGANACSPGYPAGGATREFPIIHGEHRLGEIELSFKPTVDKDDALPADVEDMLLVIVSRAAVYLARYQAERNVAAFNDELNKLSLAVEQSPNAVVITNARFQIEYVNTAFTELTGYSRAESLGRNPKELVRSNQMPAALYRHIRDTILGGQVWKGELINRKKNGDTFWDETSISPLRQAGGRITHYVAVKQDISERKFSEKYHHALLGISAALAGCRVPDDIFRTVVESVRREFAIDRCGLFLGDPDREPLKGTFGTDDEGQTIDEREHLWDIRNEPDILEALQAHRNDVVILWDRPDATGHQAALVVLRSGGRPFGILSVDNRCSGRTLNASALFHISLLSETVASSTQRARAREQLRETIRDLSEKNASLEEFARVASHDLQEPLRKIENFAAILLEDFGPKLGTQGEEYLEIMSNAATRMRQLIRDVLAFSRAGNAEQSYSQVDLNHVLRLVQDNLSVRIEERKASVIVKPLPSIMAAETQMIQLFQNLIGNGLKYNQSMQPIVEVWGENMGAEWLFHVRDNGIGIDAEHTHLIFAPFRRLHAKEEYEGSGVGLASCRRIVTRHGGEIGVESEKGSGSTFWFTIPKHPSAKSGSTDSDLIQT